jgi:hypothetical protein
VAVVTAVFENLARTAARAQGYPHLRLFMLPHPMESRPEAEVRAIIRERWREILAAIVVDDGGSAA